MTTNPNQHRNPARAGFTLVEILIVVVILSILAAVALPQFSNATLQTRENMLKDDLRFLRNQIVVFKAQHRDITPGTPVAGGTVSESDFVNQMTNFSDENRNVSANATATCLLGPYLGKMPINPLSELSTLRIVSGLAPMPMPDDSTGWIYKPATQEIIPNTSGTDSTGTRYTDY